MLKSFSLMVARILPALAIAGMIVIGIGGCSPASRPGGLAPTGTSARQPALTSPPLRAPRVGDAAPDFALDTLDGTRKVHLSDFRGKAVLLYFWAISCSACVKELPVIQRFSTQQQAAGKQLVILAVDIDDVSEFVHVVALQNRLDLTFQILVDDHYQARSSYQITDVPVTYFIDRQHFISSLVPGPLDETRLLKEASRVE